jgi:hypothetical protein
LSHFQVSKENVALKWRKKTKHMYDKPKDKTYPTTYNASINQKYTNYSKYIFFTSICNFFPFFFNHKGIPLPMQGNGRG